MNEMVNIEGIKQIANDLSTYQKELEDIYVKLMNVLSTCKQDFNDNGISYDREISDYKRIYRELNTKLKNYSEVLRNDVVVRYSNTKEDINNLFNYDLKSKMNNIINN